MEQFPHWDIACLYGPCSSTSTLSFHGTDCLDRHWRVNKFLSLHVEFYIYIHERLGVLISVRRSLWWDKVQDRASVMVFLPGSVSVFSRCSYILNWRTSCHWRQNSCIKLYVGLFKSTIVSSILISTVLRVH